MGAFDDLAKKSLQYRLGVLAFVIGAMLVVYYFTLRGPDSEEQENLASQQNRLLADQRKLDKDLEEMRRLARVYVELEQSIRDNQRALPTEAELPAFFDHLQRKAVDAGVTIRRWSRLDEQPIDMYIQVPVQVEIGGNFFNIMKYFYLLGPPQGGSVPSNAETVRISERIVSVEDLSLTEPKVVDGEMQLTANFVASTFRQVAPKQGGENAGSAVIDQILQNAGAVEQGKKPDQPAKDGDPKAATDRGATGGAQ